MPDTTAMVPLSVGQELFVEMLPAMFAAGLERNDRDQRTDVYPRGRR